MAYLQPSDYTNYGLPATTTADWITAATALINSYCRRPDLNVVWILHRRAVLNGQIRQRAGAQVSAMACPAGYALGSGKVLLVDGGDHLDHFPRSVFNRRIQGEFCPGLIGVRRVAIQAVEAQSGGNHSHRVHELIDGNSFKDRHVLESLFAHLRLQKRLSSLAPGYGGAQQANKSSCGHTDSASL